MLGLGLAASSCGYPEACFTMDKETAKVGETVTFTNCSTGANKFVIYPGDDDTIGGEFTNGQFTYIYSTPGNYKVVVSATDLKSNGEGKSNDTSKHIVITE